MLLDAPQKLELFMCLGWIKSKRNGLWPTDVARSYVARRRNATQRRNATKREKNQI